MTSPATSIICININLYLMLLVFLVFGGVLETSFLYSFWQASPVLFIEPKASPLFLIVSPEDSLVLVLEPEHDPLPDIEALAP